MSFISHEIALDSRDASNENTKSGVPFADWLDYWDLLREHYQDKRRDGARAIAAHAWAKNLAKHFLRVRACLAPIVPTDDTAALAVLMASYGHHHPDAEDIAQVRALLPYRRQPRSDFKSGQGRYPFPTYVATYADGRTARYSFWTRAGKAIDYSAGFNAAMILGRAVPIAGHVEHDGTTLPDPHFLGTAEPDSRRVTRARRPSAKDYQRQIAEINMLLARGEIDAAKQVCAR